MNNPLSLLGVSFAVVILFVTAARLSAPARRAQREERRQLIASWEQRKADDDKYWAIVRDAIRAADADFGSAGIPDRLPGRDATTTDDREGT